MGRIVTVNDLDSRIASCTKEFGSKLDGRKGKVTLCVCGGTGCLANSSSDIKTELINYIAEKGLQDKIEVNIVGCFGTQHMEWQLEFAEQTCHMFLHCLKAFV